MAKNLLILRSFLLFCLVAYASSCKQAEYWKLKLPKVPLPKALENNLHDSHPDEKATIAQPYTVGAWLYKQTDQDKPSIAQPYTVGAWSYNKDKPTIAQPYTVGAWSYKQNNQDKSTTTQPYTVGAWSYKQNDQEKPTIAQPYTVGAWSYKKNDKQDKPTIAQPYTVGAWSYKKNDQEKPSISQPYTVGAWSYKQNDENKDKQTIAQPYTVGAWSYTQNDKSKPTIAQPYTVGAWSYNQNDKDKPTIAQPYTVGAWSYNQNDKSKPTIAQPYTVGAWSYNGNDKSKPTITQPYTVGAWSYNQNDKDKPTIAQPYTVGAWWYKADKNQQNHHHHHFDASDSNSIKSSNKGNQDDDQDMVAGSVFFTEEHLRVGMKQKHDFQKSGKVKFLPRDVVEKIPFAVDKLPEILNILSVNPNSAQSMAIKDTLTTCLERPRVNKENRTCTQSLESIVDFVINELGTNNVRLKMMGQPEEEVPTGMQEYLITKVTKLDVPGNNGVACHRMIYPYALYWCHHQKDIGQYSVTLVDSRGTTVDTTAVCHYDTYAWKPDVPALRYLKIRPGDAPVCHFSGINDMFWSLSSDVGIPKTKLDATE